MEVAAEAATVSYDSGDVFRGHRTRRKKKRESKMKNHQENGVAPPTRRKKRSYFFPSFFVSWHVNFQRVGLVDMLMLQEMQDYPQTVSNSQQVSLAK
ncbi:hypothetical protein VNO80_03497 [Phaseolus coccineus]|uniref:Uncharacterized protein n=1 Tax=Phaseolus coccineus TaxID=3886 RepID=A0AAN9NRS8_PHACN